ncbi:MAG: hypothetical protein HY863_16900 [Chloroflexi bacterium]|nr:hypothetical protein [Chloroflexota bacterium]
MKILIPLSIITLIFLAGCQPSASATQTVTVQSQTTSITPCTDRGWTDVTNYLYEFDQVVDDSYQKVDISILVGQLEKIMANIKEVDVDTCTQNAHKSILSGLDNRIRGIQFMASGDTSSARNYLNFANRLIISAREELSGYGFDLNYPKK